MADVSKTIVVVLIVATILVSVIGTWTVLNAIDNIAVKNFGVSKGYGEVKVDIIKPPATATGQVTVNIVKRP